MLTGKRGRSTTEGGQVWAATVGLGVGSAVTVGVGVSVSEGVGHPLGSAVSAPGEASTLAAVVAPDALWPPDGTYATCEDPDVEAGVIESLPETVRPTTIANARVITPKPANQLSGGPPLWLAPAVRGDGNRQL
jgi:hypothetical protein